MASWQFCRPPKKGSVPANLPLPRLPAHGLHADTRSRCAVSRPRYAHGVESRDHRPHGEALRSHWAGCSQGHRLRSAVSRHVSCHRRWITCRSALLEAESNSSQIESLRRERGLEPATSSLGNWANIVNTDFSVSGSDFKRQKVTEFSILCSGLLLTEYKRSTMKDTYSRRSTRFDSRFFHSRTFLAIQAWLH